MINQFIEIIVGILLLVGLIRLWIALKCYSSPGKVRRALDDALTIKSGQRLSNHRD